MSPPGGSLLPAHGPALCQRQRLCWAEHSTEPQHQPGVAPLTRSFGASLFLLGNGRSSGLKLRRPSCSWSSAAPRSVNKKFFN